MKPKQDQDKNQVPVPSNGGFDRRSIFKPALIISAILLIVMAILATALLIG